MNKNNKYFSFMLLFLLNILISIYLASKLDFGLFIAEAFFLVFLSLLFILFIVQFVINKYKAMIVAFVFFMLCLINMVYLYFNLNNFVIILFLIVSCIGFVFSIDNILLLRGQKTLTEFF